MASSESAAPHLKGLIRSPSPPYTYVPTAVSALIYRAGIAGTALRILFVRAIPSSSGRVYTSRLCERASERARARAEQG
jgi:hypothetical protein